MSAWQIPKIWNDGECWIIGGGPSITQQFHIPEEVVTAVREKRLPLSTYSPYMESIHSKHVIGVNMAFQFGDWVDFCFFGDDGWYKDNRVALAHFTGVRVSCAPLFGSSSYTVQGERIKYVTQDPKKTHGISTVPYTVCWNANSGAAAISLAANLGATKIILLGFDMKLDKAGNSHWHKEYSANPSKKNTVFRRHLRGFPEIAKDAQRMGITILNASPDSEIISFPKMTVEAILNGAT